MTGYLLKEETEYLKKKKVVVVGCNSRKENMERLDSAETETETEMVTYHPMAVVELGMVVRLEEKEALLELELVLCRRRMVAAVDS